MSLPDPLVIVRQCSEKRQVSPAEKHKSVCAAFHCQIYFFGPKFRNETKNTPFAGKYSAYLPANGVRFNGYSLRASYT